MLTIRGIYDGKTIRPLSDEPLPVVDREVPVAILFLEDVAVESNRRLLQGEAAGRMRAARDAMPPLKESVKELVEQGRER